MKNQNQNFDDFSNDYRKIHDRNLKISGKNSDYFSEYKVVEVRKKETEKKDLQILDFGCGDGTTSEYFTRYFPKASIYGIDVSEKSIEVAKNKKILNCHLTHFDGHKIPFGDNRFDIIFIACVLHHIDRKFHEKIIKECRRVMKVGGRLYVFEHNPFNPFTRLLVRDCAFDKDVILLTTGYIKSLAKNVGFRRVRIFFTLFLPRFSIFLPFLGLEKFINRIPLGGQYCMRAIKDSRSK